MDFKKLISNILKTNHNKMWLMMCICIIAFATILRLEPKPLAFSPDESIYTKQAEYIARNGMNNYNQLVDRYISDKNSWIFPPPIRLGYLLPLSQIFNVTQIYTHTNGANLSTLCSLGSLLILFSIAWRFFNPLVTISSLLLLSTSPMDIAIARRCWSDSLYGFSIALLFLISSQFFANKKSQKLLFFSLLVLGTYISIIKENGIALVIFFTACIVAAYIYKKKPLFEIFLLPITTLCSISTGITLLTLALGGWQPLVIILSNIQQAVYTNVYANVYQNGPWYLFFHALWIASPVSLILFCLSPFAYFAKNMKLLMRQNTTCFITLMSLLFVILLISSLAFLPFIQNLRYFSIGYVPYYLLAGVGMQFLYSILERYNKKYLPFLIAAILITSIVKDRITFQNLNFKFGAGDLSTKLIVDNT